MEYTPEEIAQRVIDGVALLNREFPDWYKIASLDPWEGEPPWLPVLFPLADVHEVEVAWQTSIRLLRLLDKESKQ